MSFKIKSYTEKIDLADELEEDAIPWAKQLVSEAGDMGLAEVRRLLSLRRGTAQTVAPEGQPPEFDEGGLYESYEKIPPKVKGRIATSGVQSDHPGAGRLEYGKTDARGIRTLPHPAVGPAFQNIEEKVTDLIESRPLE